MIKRKILSAAVTLSAVLAIPASAQDGVLGPGSRHGLEPQPGPTYYTRGHYHEYGFAPFNESYPRSWLERSKSGGRSTARRPPAN
jgi:hypothetical protein